MLVFLKGRQQGVYLFFSIFNCCIFIAGVLSETEVGVEAPSELGQSQGHTPAASVPCSGVEGAWPH